MSKILVVDDSPTIRQLIMSMLSEISSDMVEAVDGEDAVRKAHEVQPDIVLLDVVLPKLNGYQVCRQLKSDPETAGIPVIMITRKAKDKDRQWGVEQGADDYITKPFNAGDLLAVVGRHVQKAH